MSKSTRPFRLLLPLVFIGGLLFGWLVIGWWLWPIQWANVAPAQLSSDHQRIYVAMAAEAYALTGDVAQAQSRLATWDNATLAATLTLLIQETTDPVVRERYIALGEALAMPQVDLSLMDVILGQKAILVTAVAAVGLFLAALGMALFPVLQQTRARQQEELLLLNGAEAGTDMDGDEQTAVSSSSAARQNNGGTETAANAGQGSAPDSAVNTTSQTNAGDQATANQPPPEETAEKLLAEATGDIQALLNSIFDEDDKLAHYDTLLHNMGDVDMVRLADRSAQMLRQLRQKNRETA